VSVTRIVAVAALAGLVLVPASAAAQMFRWTDENGAVHYGQGLDSIPQRHRAGAREFVVPSVPLPPAAAVATPAAARGTAAAPAPAAAAAPADAELARIPFTPGRRILTDVRLNGSMMVKLLLDTGADVTVVNPRVLAAMGVSSRDAVRGTLQGVTGTTNVLSFPLDSLEVQGARVGPVRIVSHDVGSADGDGLLGRDFLDHFKLTIDNGAGVVVLSPK